MEKYLSYRGPVEFWILIGCWCPLKCVLHNGHPKKKCNSGFRALKFHVWIWPKRQLVRTETWNSGGQTLYHSWSQQKTVNRSLSFKGLYGGHYSVPFCLQQQWGLYFETVCCPSLCFVCLIAWCRLNMHLNIIWSISCLLVDPHPTRLGVRNHDNASLPVKNNLNFRNKKTKF